MQYNVDYGTVFKVKTGSDTNWFCVHSPSYVPCHAHAHRVMGALVCFSSLIFVFFGMTSWYLATYALQLSAHCYVSLYCMCTMYAAHIAAARWARTRWLTYQIFFSQEFHVTWMGWGHARGCCCCRKTKTVKYSSPAAANVFNIVFFFLCSFGAGWTN